MVSGLYKYTEEELVFIKESNRFPRWVIAVLFNERFGAHRTVAHIKNICAYMGWKNGYANSKGRGYIQQSRKPIGSEKISGIKGRRYIYIKVCYSATWNAWKLKHNVIWEAAYGKIPKGRIVRFKDNDSMNCLLENLEMVDKGENTRLIALGYYNASKEARPTIKLLAKINHKVAEMSK